MTVLQCAVQSYNVLWQSSVCCRSTGGGGSPRPSHACQQILKHALKQVRWWGKQDGEGRGWDAVAKGMDSGRGGWHQLNPSFLPGPNLVAQVHMNLHQQIHSCRFEQIPLHCRSLQIFPYSMKSSAAVFHPVVPILASLHWPGEEYDWAVISFNEVNICWWSTSKTCLLLLQPATLDSMLNSQQP